MDGLLQHCNDPSVNFRSFRYRNHITAIKSIQLRIQNEECVGVPPGIDKRTGDILDNINRDSFLHLRRYTASHVPAQRISTN